MEVGNPSPINGPLILHEPMKIENDFLFNGNEDENPHDQRNWKIHPFPYLGHLDGIFELHHDQFPPFNFNILLFHPKY
jgi:hypothetical protein